MEKAIGNSQNTTHQHMQSAEVDPLSQRKETFQMLVSESFKNKRLNELKKVLQFFEDPLTLSTIKTVKVVGISDYYQLYDGTLDNPEHSILDHLEMREEQENGQYRLVEDQNITDKKDPLTRQPIKNIGQMPQIQQLLEYVKSEVKETSQVTDNVDELEVLDNLEDPKDYTKVIQNSFQDILTDTRTKSDKQEREIQRLKVELDAQKKATREANNVVRAQKKQLEAQTLASKSLQQRHENSYKEQIATLNQKLQETTTKIENLTAKLTQKTQETERKRNIIKQLYKISGMPDFLEWVQKQNTNGRDGSLPEYCRYQNDMIEKSRENAHNESIDLSGDTTQKKRRREVAPNGTGDTNSAATAHVVDLST